MLCLVSYVWCPGDLVDWWFVFHVLGVSTKVESCGVLGGCCWVQCHNWVGVQGMCGVLFWAVP